MTTELEEQFYKTFGIEPIPLELYGNWFVKGTIKDGMVYPEISDSRLLKMICILVKTQTTYPINKSNIKDIKDEVLQRCINLKSNIKHQIQQLFKEGE